MFDPGMGKLSLKDLKPAQARKLQERAARAYEAAGVDPNGAYEGSFEGRLDVVNGCRSVVFTHHVDLVFFAEAVPVKHLKRGKKKGA